MNTVRVCIDATPLLLRSAGVKTYVYYWIQALRKQLGDASVGVFPPIGAPGACVHDRSVTTPLRTLAGLACLHSANASPVRLLNAFGSQIDVFHASHQLLKPPSNTRVSATLYDMTCWLVPHMHSAANVRMAKKFADRVLRRADGLVAISQATKADAVRILNLDPDRIAVIYPGVAEAFFQTYPKPAGKPYILFIGTVEPRKNVGVLLDAYEQLPGQLRGEFDLVLAGSPGWGDPAIMNRLHSGIPGVRYLGYVSEADLPALNAGATLFVYPSLYEGFGLPVAQAMAAGVPVITSNVSSLPEVASGAGILVDPTRPEALAEAFVRMLSDSALRQRCAVQGQTRAQTFRWRNCALESVRFFEHLAQGQPAASLATSSV